MCVCVRVCMCVHCSWRFTSVCGLHCHGSCVVTAHCHFGTPNFVTVLSLFCMFCLYVCGNEHFVEIIVIMNVACSQALRNIHLHYYNNSWAGAWERGYWGGGGGGGGAFNKTIELRSP